MCESVFLSRLSQWLLLLLICLQSILNNTSYSPLPYSICQCAHCEPPPPPPIILREYWHLHVWHGLSLTVCLSFWSFKHICVNHSGFVFFNWNFIFLITFLQKEPVPDDYYKVNPEHKHIYRFIRMLFNAAQLTSECAIVTLVRHLFLQEKKLK